MYGLKSSSSNMINYSGYIHFYYILHIFIYTIEIECGNDKALIFHFYL